MHGIALLIALLALKPSSAAPFDPKAECAMILVGQALPESFGNQRQRISPLSDHEMDNIFRQIERDPSLRSFHAAVSEQLAKNTELGQAIRTVKSDEGRFLLAFMKWLAYRSAKGELPDAKENAEKARILDAAMQKTNIMEIMDRLVVRLLKGGQRIPAPITRLLNELMQGGVERIQVAANTFMLNGSIGDIVQTLEVLQTSETFDSHALYVAVMKLWELDGGAPYAIQKTKSEFTAEEKAFFIELDPNSPLTLPSRHYSKMEIDAIRGANRGTPLSKLTVEQVDRAVAYRDKWSMGHETMDEITARYPGREYKDLSLDEIDAALGALGEQTLMARAARMREGFRVLWEKKPAKSLLPPKTGIVPAPKGSNALVPTESSHPLALALALTQPNEIVGYTNAASQLAGVKEVAARMESAIAKLDRNSPEFSSSVEVYRTFLNLSLYAPNSVARAEGVIDVLSVASVEVGTERERAEVLDLVHGGYEKIRALMWRGHYSPKGKLFIEVATSLSRMVEVRKHWDLEMLDYVLDKFEWLATFESPDAINPQTAEALLLEFRAVRRDEPIDADSLMEALTTAKEPARVEYGVLSFKVSLAEVSITKEKGRIVRIEKLEENQKDSGEFSHDLGKLEKLLKAAGYTGYEIVEPTYHLMNWIDAQHRYVRVKFEKPFGQHKQLREESTFYRNFDSPGVNFDPTDLTRFLRSGSMRKLVQFGSYKIHLLSVNVNMVTSKTGKTLTIERIDSEQPGSGLYEPTLRAIEQYAREAGYVALIIDVVENPKHWEFYTSRMGYSRHPRDSDRHRSFFIEL